MKLYFCNKSMNKLIHTHSIWSNMHSMNKLIYSYTQDRTQTYFSWDCIYMYALFLRPYMNMLTSFSKEKMDSNVGKRFLLKKRKQINFSAQVICKVYMDLNDLSTLYLMQGVEVSSLMKSFLYPLINNFLLSEVAQIIYISVAVGENQTYDVKRTQFS